VPPITVDRGGELATIVQLKLAGVGSLVPDVSTALTWKLRVPAAKLLTIVGLVQGENALLSRLH
jgi:hypothetical protein